MKKLLSIVAVGSLMSSVLNATTNTAGNLVVHATIKPSTFVHIGSPIKGITTDTNKFEKSTLVLKTPSGSAVKSTHDYNFEVYATTNTKSAVTINFTPGDLVHNLDSSVVLPTAYKFTAVRGKAINNRNIISNNNVIISTASAKNNVKIGVLTITPTVSAHQLAGLYTKTINATIVAKI